MGRLGGPEDMALLRNLQSDPNPAVRCAALVVGKRLEPIVASREPF
jgi:hypothetical protein